jgi:hypothetical protein
MHTTFWTLTAFALCTVTACAQSEVDAWRTACTPTPAFRAALEGVGPSERSAVVMDHVMRSNEHAEVNALLQEMGELPADERYMKLKNRLVVVGVDGCPTLRSVIEVPITPALPPKLGAGD